jgi:hypothetical protein
MNHNNSYCCMHITSIQVPVFILGLCRFVLNVWDTMQGSGEMKKHWTGQNLASRNLLHQCWKVISSSTKDMITELKHSSSPLLLQQSSKLNGNVPHILSCICSVMIKVVCQCLQVYWLDVQLHSFSTSVLNRREWSVGLPWENNLQ